MFGIYPYTAVTEKQREAMKQANVDYVYRSIIPEVLRSRKIFRSGWMLMVSANKKVV
ncbi:MAG: hypothetical protein K6A69_03130 [Lachnospiraceae bacterium]|nr:hypothetical protein [Lachnospiraceae bacterium]